MLSQLGVTVQELSFLVQHVEKLLRSDPSRHSVLKDMKIDQAKLRIQEYTEAEHNQLKDFNDSTGALEQNQGITSSIESL